MANDLTLVIETSNPSSGSAGEVGLARGAELIAVRALDPKDRHDDALIPTIEALSEEAGVTAEQIGRVAVSVGPGGYSSVRIAVSAAKMIALATGAECVGVPSCRVAACGAGITGVVAVVMAGKREQGWSRAYRVGDGLVEPMSEGESLDERGFAALCGGVEVQAIVADAYLPSAMREWAIGEGVEIVAPVMTTSACLAASTGLASVTGAELEAVYPREPEAVRKWRDLHG